MPFRIGIIADTHGLVRPEIADVFANVDHIIHAGDIGGAHVLKALRAIAPVTYVKGNNDDASGEDIVRATFDAFRVLVTHILPKPEKPAASRSAAAKPPLWYRYQSGGFSPPHS